MALMFVPSPVASLDHPKAMWSVVKYTTGPHPDTVPNSYCKSFTEATKLAHQLNTESTMSHPTEIYAADAAEMRRQRRLKFEAERAVAIVATGEHTSDGSAVYRIDASCGLSVLPRLLDTLCICGAAIADSPFTQTPSAFYHLACHDLLARGEVVPMIPSADEAGQGGLF